MPQALEQMPQTWNSIEYWRLVLETWLLLKHCQLATLSFSVCRPTVCGVRDLKDEAPARFSFMLLEKV